MVWGPSGLDESTSSNQIQTSEDEYQKELQLTAAATGISYSDIISENEPEEKSLFAQLAKKKKQQKETTNKKKIALLSAFKDAANENKFVTNNAILDSSGTLTINQPQKIPESSLPTVYDSPIILVLKKFMDLIKKC